MAHEDHRGLPQPYLAHEDNEDEGNRCLLKALAPAAFTFAIKIRFVFVFVFIVC